MSFSRVNNQTGLLAVGNLAAATGAGGTFNLGAAWAPATPANQIKILMDPPVAGIPNPSFEVIYATVAQGSALATIVLRGQEGTSAVLHTVGAVWACGPTAQDFSTDLLAAGTGITVTGSGPSTIAHGTGILPNAHHNQNHSDSDHAGANSVSVGTAPALLGAYTGASVRNQVAFIAGPGLAVAAGDDVTLLKGDIKFGLSLLTVLAASGTYTIPAAATALKITCVGGGGGGGGGGSASNSSATLQVGGSGGGAGATTVAIFTGLTGGNTLTVTVGAGGGGGNGGAGNGASGNAGTVGVVGGDTSVTSGTQTIGGVLARGGGLGNPSAANSTTVVLGGAGGRAGSTTSLGSGGNSNLASQGSVGWGGTGGSGGGTATATLGGGGGGGGSNAIATATVGSASGTSAGVVGVAALTAGSGGGGGGGGAGTATAGAGGGGGAGMAGQVVIEVVG